MKRFFCLILALLLSALLCTSAFASVLDENEAYMSGDYYAALKAVHLTGNMRSDIVSVALSQVGYHEGKSENDITGDSTGKDNFTQYGHAYGINGDAWCASFIWWCAREANIGASIIPKTEWAKTMTFNCRSAAFSDCGQITPGDLAFFDNSNSDGLEDHVGIIVDVTDSTITTVEGNFSNAVRTNIYNRKDGKLIDGSGAILSIGFPDYERGNISFEYQTQFILAQERVDTYDKLGGAKKSSLAQGEYLLIAQKDIDGERWYQVAYGLNSYYIKSDNTSIIIKNAPPITGCDWLEVPDIECGGIIEPASETTSTTAETTQSTTEQTTSTQASIATAEVEPAVISEADNEAVSPEYESIFSEDWLKYALYGLLGVLLISIIVIIVSGVKVHNDDKKGMW